MKTSLELFIEAVVRLDAYLNDLEHTNPGYLGKLGLQNYQQFNEAMIARERAMRLIDAKTKETILATRI